MISNRKIQSIKQNAEYPELEGKKQQWMINNMYLIFDLYAVDSGSLQLILFLQSGQ